MLALRTSVFDDPVRFPGLAVDGEGLLPVSRVLALPRPLVAHDDRLPVIGVVPVEVALAPAEPADDGLEHFAARAVDPVERPLLLLQIEYTQRHSRPALRGEYAFVDVHHAVHAAFATERCGEGLP